MQLQYYPLQRCLAAESNREKSPGFQLQALEVDSVLVLGSVFAAVMLDDTSTLRPNSRVSLSCQAVRLDEDGLSAPLIRPLLVFAGNLDAPPIPSSLCGVQELCVKITPWGLSLLLQLLWNCGCLFFPHCHAASKTRRHRTCDEFIHNLRHQKWQTLRFPVFFVWS